MLFFIQPYTERRRSFQCLPHSYSNPAFTSGQTRPTQRRFSYHFDAKPIGGQQTQQQSFSSSFFPMTSIHESKSSGDVTSSSHGVATTSAAAAAAAAQASHSINTQCPLDTASINESSFTFGPSGASGGVSAGGGNRRSQMTAATAKNFSCPELVEETTWPPLTTSFKPRSGSLATIASIEE